MSNSWLSSFKSVVPRGVKVAAVVLLAAAAVASAVIAFMHGAADAQVNRGSGEQFPLLFFIGFCFLAACFLAVWLLAVGYVHGDAKRRGMQAGIWTLLVVLTPNLIGFLLYFALRKPLLAACSNCGAGVGPEQRFCSACGSQQNISGSNPSAGASGFSASAPSGLRKSGVSLRSFAVGFAVWVGIFLSKSLFALLKHAVADAAALFGIAAVGMIFLLFVQLKPVPAR